MGAVLALLIGLQAVAALPPAPPADPVRTLRKVVVEAIRNCPQSHGDEIVVCGKDIGEAPPAWRYPRLAGDPGQRFDPKGEVASVSRERHALTEGGEAGTGSCSTVGGGGFTGCMTRQWRRNDQQRGN